MCIRDSQGPKSRSRQTPRTSTGGPCLGARGKQAQLAQANGSKFNLLLMLVAQMSTYPRVIATHYCSWGSRNFKLTHGALTAFEDLGVVAVAVPRRARRCFSAHLRRPPTQHRNLCRTQAQPPAEDTAPDLDKPWSSSPAKLAIIRSVRHLTVQLRAGRLT